MSAPFRISVAPVGAGAAGRLARLHRRVFARGWDEGAFRALLQCPGVEALVATAGRGGQREPAGFVLTRAAAGEAEVLTIVVCRGWRRRGIGAALLAQAVVRLAASGVTALHLEVAADNAPALALYRRWDFAPCGRRAGYYPRRGGRAADALMMRLDLAAARRAGAAG